MHLRRTTLFAATAGVASVALLATGAMAASVSSARIRSAAVRACVQTHVHNQSGHVNVQALQTCLRAARGGSSSSVSSSRSSSSIGGMNSSRSSSLVSSSASSLSMSRSSMSSVSSAPASSTSSSVSSSSQSSLASVTISNVAFTPSTLTVKKGTTVRWTNNDTAKHTVTRDSVPGPFSPALKQGESYSYTFTKVGTFPYHCFFHDHMTGSVTVTE